MGRASTSVTRVAAAAIATVDGRLPWKVPSAGTRSLDPTWAAGHGTEPIRRAVHPNGQPATSWPSYLRGGGPGNGHRETDDDKDKETGMGRRLIVALVLGLAVAGWMGVGGTVAAQEPEPGDPIPGTMALSGEVVAPGDEVTAESVSPCHPEGVVEWRVIKLSGGPLPFHTAQADAEGHWSIVFTAVEAPTPRGNQYRFEALCTLGEEPTYTYFADLTIRSAGQPEPEPEPEPEPDPAPDPALTPATAAPADPVRVDPDFAG
jgi:hypothetical protein